MSSKADESILRPTMTTGTTGVRSLVETYNKGTPEMNRLISTECDVILECKTCRSLFRSILNFVAHKRSYCRTQFEALAEETGDNKNNNEKDEDAEEGDESGDKRHKMFNYGGKRGKKYSANTRTLNPMTRIVKRMGTTIVKDKQGRTLMQMHSLPSIAKVVPNTKFVDGVQVICEPSALNMNSLNACEDDDQVVMVLPQDCTSSYLNMQLRRRKEKPVQANKVNTHQAHMIGRLLDHSDVDADARQCRRDACDKQFNCLQALAIHCSIAHKPLNPTKELKDRILCYLCGQVSPTIKTLKQHIETKHQYFKGILKVLEKEEKEDRKNKESSEGNKIEENEMLILSPTSPRRHVEIRGKNRLERLTAMKLIKKYSNSRSTNNNSKKNISNNCATDESTHIEDYTFDKSNPRKIYEYKTSGRVRCSKCKTMFNSRRGCALHWQNSHMHREGPNLGLKKYRERQRQAALKKKKQYELKRAARKTVAENEIKPKEELRDEESGEEEEEEKNDRSTTSPESDGGAGPKRSKRLATRSKKEGRLSIMDKLSKQQQRKDLDTFSPNKGGNCVERASSTSSNGNQEKTNSQHKKEMKSLSVVVDALVSDVIKQESVQQFSEVKRQYKKRKLDNLLGKQPSPNDSPMTTPIVSLSQAKEASATASSFTSNVSRSDVTLAEKRKQFEQLYHKINNSKLSNAATAHSRRSAPAAQVRRSAGGRSSLKRAREKSMGDKPKLVPIGSLPAQEREKNGTTSKVGAYPVELLNYEKDEDNRKGIPPPPYYSPPGDPPNWMFVARGIVSLNDDQKKILNNVLDDERQTCKMCNRRFGSSKLVRTHVMNHIKLVRFKCNMCDCAAFFCADMRRHLVYGYCPGVTSKDFVKPGDEVNRNNIAEVDKHISLVDPFNPSKVLVWDKTVISSEFLGPKCYKAWTIADEKKKDPSAKVIINSTHRI